MLNYMVVLTQLLILTVQNTQALVQPLILPTQLKLTFRLVLLLLLNTPLYQLHLLS
jgi:hypothetical protein